MRATTSVTLWIVRIAGAVQIVFGLLLWTGRANAYLSVHILNGILIVLALWALAIVALVARARRGLAIFGLLWGLAVAAFGMRQGGIMIGDLHWIIRAIHLLMGLAAIGIAVALGRAALAVIPRRERRARLESGAAAARRSA